MKNLKNILTTIIVTVIFVCATAMTCFADNLIIHTEKPTQDQVWECMRASDAAYPVSYMQLLMSYTDGLNDFIDKHIVFSIDKQHIENGSVETYLDPIMIRGGELVHFWLALNNANISDSEGRYEAIDNFIQGIKSMCDFGTPPELKDFSPMDGFEVIINNLLTLLAP